MVAAPPLQRSDLELELAALPENVGTVRDAVTSLAREKGFSPEAISALAVAVNEAASNVVVHAYHDQPARGLLRVCAVMQDGEMSVVVSDDGPGVRPRVDSPGLGLGLPLMATLALDFEVGVDSSGRNCVRMSFGSEAGPTSLRTRGRFARRSSAGTAGEQPAHDS